MRKILKEFLRGLTFRRQLSITVTLGVFLLALFSSLAGSWQSNQRVRLNLLEQGERIAENLAHQSTLALLTASAENVAEAVNATMAFPGVVGITISDTGQRTLLTKGNVGANELPMLEAHPDTKKDVASLNAENARVWRFVAPVYTQPAADSPFHFEVAKPELLGQVAVVMSKDELSHTTISIFTTNLITSLSFALLFLFLIRFLTNRMTRPLNQLSAKMGQAKAGESQVRAHLGGPRDIVDMAHAFNSMMEVLDEREAALRVAAIAFEIEEAMIVTDQHEVVVRVNRVFSQLTGYSAEEAIGKKLSMLKCDKKDEGFYARMQEALHRDNYWQGEIWNRRKSGDVYPEWLTITAVVGTDNNITNYIVAFFDITERKLAEEKIHHLAFYDPLTQLPNRRLLFERLHQAVTANTRNHTSAALVFIDLDNFKMLNDTRGHDIGDLLLIEVAQRLKSCLRDEDTLARLGGDEFVMLLEGLNPDWTRAAIQARRVAEKALVSIGQPYMLENMEEHSSTSIGISLFSNYKEKPDDLIKQADTAMYAAKKAGRNTLRFFDPEMQEVLETRNLLETGLRRALQLNEFRLYYQVQMGHNLRPVGAEALLRWEHPEEGLISPLKFIPVAEETGLILPIGLWVLRTACAQLKTWESDPLARGLSLAVNVSAKQFRKPDFVRQVIEEITQSGIDPTRLKLELTESTVLENVADTVEKMHTLRAYGLHFSMDDFGTGYSSLAYLTQLPLDQLKIDQSFVRNISSKSSDSMIVQTIIGMAHNLNIEVIAEGVETQAQRDFLLGAGCKLYQGYLYSEPVSLDKFAVLLNDFDQRKVDVPLSVVSGT